ncbi:MAG: hypothetical protein ACFWT6_12165 [Virgibacillus proomii]|jgi:hypothetical protein
MESKDLIEEDKCIIEGLGETTAKVNVLIQKMKEARTIASELASTEIVIKDKRQKDIMDYVTELKKEFIQSVGYEPSRYYLVAEDDSFQCQIHLHL